MDRTTIPASLSVGKYRRLKRLSDERGRFAMLAIDQRGSLRRMIARHTADAPDEVSADALRQIKRVVTETIAPLSTAVLTDPIYGYPATVDVIPTTIGVLLSAEVTGYEATNGAERRSRLIDEWSVEQSLRAGADAVKLLIYHHPEASPATRQHEQDIVERVGAACAEAELPFVLEVVTYALEGQDAADFARVKPDLVADGARMYSDPRFKVDLLKLEFPADLKYAEAYRRQPFASGTVVHDQAAVEEACRQLDAAADVPWVILSAGVDIEEFVENVRLATAAGASGFLCGRAVWKHLIEDFPDEAGMRAHAEEAGRQNFRRLLQANADATPLFEHPRFEVTKAQAS